MEMEVPWLQHTAGGTREHILVRDSFQAACPCLNGDGDSKIPLPVNGLGRGGDQSPPHEHMTTSAGHSSAPSCPFVHSCKINLLTY